MLKTFELSNGIHVASYLLPSVRSIHIRISTKGGSIVEGKNLRGIAHFMEHMLVQGIPSLPNVEEFSSSIESLAGSYSAFTENLLVGFNITLPFTHLEDGLKIASEVFYEPLFSEDAIKREKGVVIDEVKQKMDSHWYKISEFFHKAILKHSNPLTVFTGNSIKVLPKIHREHIIEFWKKYFVPKNTYLLITGHFDREKLPEMLEKYFGKHNTDRGFLGYPKMSKDDFLPGGVKLRSDKSLKTNYIDFVFPSLSLSDPMDLRIKQNLSLIILGQLRNSRLFKLLRYQKGLVYGVRAGSAKYPDIGYAAVSSEVPSEHLEEVVRLITIELKGYIKNGPSQEELDFAKHYLTNQWLMAFDHPSSIANWVEGDLLWEKKVMLPEEASKIINQVKPQDILEVMQKYWDFEFLSLVIQGSFKKSKEMVDKYSKIVEDLKYV